MANPFNEHLDRYQKMMNDLDAAKKPRSTGMSDEGFDDLRKHEAFRSKVYLDQAGHPTIGYGHKLTQEEIDSGIFKDGISQEKANELMKGHPTLNNVTKAVAKMKTGLNSRQRDSLISAGYNIGPTAIKKVIKTIEEKGIEAGAERLKKYNKVRDAKGKLVPSKGLSTRRTKEAESLLDADDITKVERSPAIVPYERGQEPEVAEEVSPASFQEPLESLDRVAAFEDGGAVIDPNKYSFFGQPEGQDQGAFDPSRYDMSQNVMDPEAPEAGLMQQLEAEQIAEAKRKEGIDNKNFLGSILKGVTNYGTNSANAAAQKASVRDLGLKKSIGEYKEIEYKRRNAIKEAMEKAKMLKSYKDLQSGSKSGMTEYQKFQVDQKKDTASYKKEQDKLDNAFREKKLQDMITARKEKGLGGGSTDPNSEASKIARSQAKFLTDRDFPESFTEAQINSMSNAFGKKITTGHQRTNLELREEKFKLSQLKERRVEAEQERNFAHKTKVYKEKFQRLAPKEADRYESLVNEQRYVDRIDKLFSAVKTGKKHYYKDLVKNWIPDAEHDEAFVRLNTLTGQSLFAYIKNISGAQFSDAERVRFEELMPGVGDNPTKAAAKIKSWRKTLGQRRDVFSDRVNKMGIKMPNLWGKTSTTFSEKRKQATRDKVREAKPNWTAEQVEAALKKKYKDKW